MTAIHFYLVAWVLGGMLLGASMLLEGRDVAQPQPPSTTPDTPAVAHASSRGPWWAVKLAAFGLIGFGLCGLAASGLGFDLWPSTLLCAAAVGSALMGVGRALCRSV